MKLSPPASSSDLEAAREVARRLNRIALPPEPPRPLPPYTPLHHGRPAGPGAIPPLPVPTAPMPPPAPPPPAAAPPPAATAAPPEAPAFTRSEPEPEPEPEHEPEMAPVAEPETPAASSYVEEPTAQPAALPPPPSAAEAASEPPPAEAAEPAPYRPAPASFDTDTGPLVEEPGIEEDLGPEDQVEEAEAETPLSWADVVGSCLALAEGKGALLIDPEGHVIAVAGDWPAPGAEAIAARLVPAMDKALKDAPTRSVSVPLGGLHLTAWRAPMTKGLMTIGFVAEAPLRPDLRPSIDATLKQGPQ